MYNQASLLLAFAASASCHMIMGSPKPFQFENTNTQQAPLTLADFPCKQPSGTYASNGATAWPVGTQQTVSFIGGATHSGGSCQFSITTDTKPTKQSQWKVIQSVIGGCPYAEPGNLSGNATDDRSNKYPVTMPKDVPSGSYTFAWTWLNKSGNREFYMNCAPIQVSGGSGSKDALASLPDMFVANLDDTCSTAENQDFQYPNPGTNVVTGSSAKPGNAFGNSQGCAAITKMGSGNGQMGSPSQPTQYSAQASQPAASSAAAPSATNYPGVFAPGASSASSSPAASASVPAAYAPSAPAASASTPAAYAPSAPAQPLASSSYSKNSNNYDSTNINSTNTGHSNGCTPCSTDGAVVCISAQQYGLCNRGCAVAQQLAQGMVCSDGKIGRATKRSIHFPRAHLHRRHGSPLL